jgi:hypothetical protein
MEVDDLGAACVEEVCAIMAPLLGWNHNDARREAWRFRISLERERRATSDPSDPETQHGSPVPAHRALPAVEHGVLVRSFGSRRRDDTAS